MSSKPTIIFLGNERLATGVSTTAPTLQALVDAGYTVAAVVSNFERAKSRNARDLEIAAMAQKNDIPVLLPEKPGDILDELRAYRAEIGVLVAYGKIVPQSVIDIFPHGIVNIHPSLLPLHRGPTPIESVILEGATETGVSIMSLVKAMDAGPVYAQERLQLDGSETKQELADALLQQGGRMLIELLPRILDANMQPWEQDDDAATYDNRISKEDGVLDFAKPAEQLEREIRAFAIWPGSRIILNNKDITITKAHVLSENISEIGTIWLEHKQFGFQTSNGILVIDTLKPAGKSEMTAEAFLAGYRNVLEK